MAAIMDDDYKKIIDFLSKTLKYGEKIQNDLLKCDEEKCNILSKIKNKINESMIKHNNLKQELKNLNTEINDAKLRVEKDHSNLNIQLLTLDHLTKILNKSNNTVKRLNSIEKLQEIYL
jgi:hypothetical protein